MASKRFAIRTVKDGSIKVFGMTLVPIDARNQYDGRFEGHRLAFAMYYIGKERQPFVSLWGTERDYRCHSEDMPDWGKPPVCMNGVFEFAWWETVEETARRQARERVFAR